MIAPAEGGGAEMFFDGNLVMIQKNSEQFYQNQNLPILR